MFESNQYMDFLYSVLVLKTQDNHISYTLQLLLESSDREDKFKV